MTKIHETDYWRLILLRGSGLRMGEIGRQFGVVHQTVGNALRKIRRKCVSAFDGDYLECFLYYMDKDPSSWEKGDN